MRCTSLNGIVKWIYKKAANLGNQGAALITALLFLLVLTMLGIASIMTSSTEIMISRNDRLNKLALDNANAGIQEALARIDLQTGALQLGNYTTKALTADPARSWHFLSADVPTIPSFINFSGSVTYRLEDSLHYRGVGGGPYDPTHHQVVGYSKDCGYDKSPLASINTAFPVYVITSTGRVRTAGAQTASAKVVVEVSKNTINLDVPGALYSASCIDANGNVTVTGGDKPSYVTSCTTLPNGIDLHGNASHFTSSATPSFQAGAGSITLPNMTDTSAAGFLGMGLDEIQAMAAASNTSYVKTGATWSPGAPNPPWGGYATTTNPKIVYIDPGTTGGVANTYTMNGNTDNYGILVVKGDLQISGHVTWKGLVYITGNLTTTGTSRFDGGVMVGGASTTTLSGTVDVIYDKAALDSVTRQAFYTKIINWRRVLN